MSLWTNPVQLFWCSYIAASTYMHSVLFLPLYLKYGQLPLHVPITATGRVQQLFLFTLFLVEFRKLHNFLKDCHNCLCYSMVLPEFCILVLSQKCLWLQYVQQENWTGLLSLRGRWSELWPEVYNYLNEVIIVCMIDSCKSRVQKALVIGIRRLHFEMFESKASFSD